MRTVRLGCKLMNPILMSINNLHFAFFKSLLILFVLFCFCFCFFAFFYFNVVAVRSIEMHKYLRGSEGFYLTCETDTNIYCKVHVQVK